MDNDTSLIDKVTVYRSRRLREAETDVFDCVEQIKKMTFEVGKMFETERLMRLTRMSGVHVSMDYADCHILIRTEGSNENYLIFCNQCDDELGRSVMVTVWIQDFKTEHIKVLDAYRSAIYATEFENIYFEHDQVRNEI